MSNIDSGQSPTDRYQTRIMLAALTKCRDQDEAAKLLAQYMTLAPHIQQVVDRTEQLADSHEFRQAISLLNEMIDRVGQFTSPYPADAVRDVFGYEIARLYFLRAVARFSGSSGSADPLSALNTALADLDRAQSYPRACFAELNPELPDKMSEFRAIVQVFIKKHEEKKTGGTPPPKSTGCMTLIAICGLAGLLGVILV